jgi:predicted metal-dependent phosphoesterase TrpH
LQPERVDLHCHSTASDGHLTPAQLVARGKQLGLKALALTDHDTVAGLGLFESAGQAQGIETVPGVEVSTDYPTGTMHLLGLLIDSQSQALRAFLKQLADGRRVRNPQIIKQLNQIGLAITMEEVEVEAGVSSAGIVGVGLSEKSIGRPHISAVLIKKGYVESKQEAFDKYLAKGRPAYVPRFLASPEESIKQIHSANGLAVLAHPPYIMAKDEAELERIVGELKSKGLDGIEVYFSTHTAEQTALCERLAAEFGLLMTGGSDFHGDLGRGGTKVELGTGVHNRLFVSYELVQKLKEHKARRLQ